MTTYDETITDSMNMTGADAPTGGVYHTVIESLAFSEATPLTDVLTITHTLSFSDPLTSTWVRICEIVDSANFTDTPTPAMVFALTVTESISLSEVWGAVRMLADLVTEALQMSESASSSWTGTTAIVDNLQIVEGTARSGSVYVAWVMNADNGAVTRYADWDVNAGAKFKGKYIGSGDGGVYELEGADDDGSEISASISLPRTDFGVSEKKGMQYAYLGVRADGDLVVRVAADEGDHYEYPLKPRSETELENARAVLGKGLKGRYFQVDIANVGGADFEIDSVELTPIPTKRRI